MRSQKQEAAQDEDVEEGAWSTDEEDEGGVSAPVLQASPGTPSAGEELVAVMRTFLEGQLRRGEGFLAELMGLRASWPAPQLGQAGAEPRPVAPIQAPPRAPSLSESLMSLRMDLPTPAAPRRSSPFKGIVRVF